MTDALPPFRLIREGLMVKPGKDNVEVVIVGIDTNAPHLTNIRLVRVSVAEAREFGQAILDAAAEVAGRD